MAYFIIFNNSNKIFHLHLGAQKMKTNKVVFCMNILFQSAVILPKHLTYLIFNSFFYSFTVYVHISPFVVVMAFKYLTSTLLLLLNLTNRFYCHIIHSLVLNFITELNRSRMIH